MKRVLPCLGATVVAALISLSAPVSASPLTEGVQPPAVNAAYAQYEERRIIRRGAPDRYIERRAFRPERRRCRTEIVRRETRRGTIVERVRRCF